MYQMRFIVMVPQKRLMKMIAVMQRQGGAAEEAAGTAASSSQERSSLEVNTWLRFQRSKGKEGQRYSNMVTVADKRLDAFM